jgi:hypothetical protein
MNRPRDKNFNECVNLTIALIPDAYLKNLLISTHERYEYHLNIATVSRDLFEKAHYFLTFAIPIYSAIFTYIASNGIILSRNILGGIGLLLTIMTIVASILKPYGRFVAAAQTLIALNTWKADFIVSLGNMQLETVEPKNTLLYDFLTRKDLEMSKIGATLMDLIFKPNSNADGGADGEKE